MKIVIVPHYYPPHMGGIEVVAERQARMLADAGHDVCVITSRTRGSERRERRDGVEIVRLPVLNVLEKKGIPFPLFYPTIIVAMARRVKASDAVQVHDAFYMSSWTAAFFAAWYRKPLVLVQHVGFVEYPSAFVRFVQRVVYATMGGSVFRASERIIVYNPIVRDFLLARGVPHERIVMMGNGIDTSRYRPTDTAGKRAARRAFGLPEEKPIVLFVGRLVPKKGFTAAFDARDAAYDIVFAGPGIVPDEWEAQKDVHFLGPVSQDRLPDLYRAADLFVAPMCGEIFTLTVQEAASTGLPVIMTDEPAYAAYDLDRARISLIVPSSEAIRAEIMRLLPDSETRAAMGTYARAYALAHFDAEKNSELFLQIYRSLSKPVTVTTSLHDGHVLDLKLSEGTDEHSKRRHDTALP